MTDTPPGAMPAAAFTWPVRIYWEDTDGGGVVYYANYLKFLERARTEWLRSLGFVQTELAKDPGIVFVVASLSIDYKRPARLDDALTVTCDVQPEGAVCIRFVQRIVRGSEKTSEVLVEASCRVACLDATTFRPRRLPASLAAAVSQAANQAARTRVEAPAGAKEPIRNEF